MERTRLDDMLERYGEVCTQKDAAKMLSINPRTIQTMLTDGRLRRIGHRVDVRSICAYLENPNQVKFSCSIARRPRTAFTQEEFLAAARTGRWAPARKDGE